MTLVFEQRRLKYAASLNDDSLSESTDPDFEVKYVDIGNVDSQGNINELALYPFKKAPSRARRQVKHGDVIISTVRTYLQAIAPIKDPESNLIVSTGFAVARPNPFILSDDYFKYAARESYFLWEVQARSKGVSYPAINSSELADILISLPPIEVQQRIATYIDRETTEIDTLVAEKEQMLTLLEEKREVLISHTVTHGINPNIPFKFSGLDWLGDIPQHWKIERLKFIAEVQTGVTLGKKYQNEELAVCPYLRVANVQDGFLDLNFITEISMPKKDVPRYQLEYGDVLMTEGGDFDKLGRGYVWEGQIENCLHQNHIFAVRPFAKYLDSYFLAVLMRSHYGKAYFISTSKQTTNLATTNQTNLLNFYLPVPPIEEQKLIVEYLNLEIGKADELLAAIKDSIALLKERRSALITAAVTGQIKLEDMRG